MVLCTGVHSRFYRRGIIDCECGAVFKHWLYRRTVVCPLCHVRVELDALRQRARAAAAARNQQQP